MRYTTLSIRKHNHVRKYVLFYADYLNEAWLSEVKDDEKTSIVRQFKCKDTDDFAELLADLSRMGDIVNLASDETIEQHLAKLNMKLEKPSSQKLKETVTVFLDRLLASFSLRMRSSRSYRTA